MPEAISTQNLVTLPITSQELGRGGGFFAPLTKIGLSNSPATIGLKRLAEITLPGAIPELSVSWRKTVFRIQLADSLSEGISSKDQTCFTRIKISLKYAKCHNSRI